MLRHIAGWIAVLAVMLGISAVLGLYKYREIATANAAAQNAPEPSEAIASARARLDLWSPTTKAIGTVVARQQLEIRNELAGTIVEIGFNSGDVVEPGQVLFRFDARQEQALLDAAYAEARLAKATLERRQNLRNSPAFAPQEFDKAEAEYAAAIARARNLEAVIDKKKIVAPFRARIGITNLQPGAYLDAGTQLGTLQGVDSDSYIDFSLPQDSAAMLRRGSQVKVSSLSIPSGTASAEIIASSEAVDRANRTVQFRAVVKGLGAALRPGMFVDVVAQTSEPEPVILVPLTAVRLSPYGQHVFALVNDGTGLRARQRRVRTGPVIGNEIVIREGLKDGELIATSGSFKLRDNQLVRTDLPVPAAATASAN